MASNEKTAPSSDMSPDSAVTLETVGVSDGWMHAEVASTVLLRVTDSGCPVEFSMSSGTITMSAALLSNEEDSARWEDTAAALFLLDSETRRCGFSEQLSDFLRAATVGDRFRVRLNDASKSGGNGGQGEDGQEVTFEGVLRCEQLEALGDAAARLISKVVVKEPQNKLAANTRVGSIVDVRFKVGDVAEWTTQRQVKLGSGQLEDLLEFAVAGMGEGEVSYLSVSADARSSEEGRESIRRLLSSATQAGGLADLLVTFSAAADLRLAVALERVEEPNVARMWTQLAVEGKEKGTALLQGGRLLLARRVFLETAALVRQESSITARSKLCGEDDAALQAYRGCLSNCALADLKLARLNATSESVFARSAVRVTTELLSATAFGRSLCSPLPSACVAQQQGTTPECEEDLKNTSPSGQEGKALFRRAQARELLCEFDDALGDARLLMSQVDGKNKEFIALAHHIKDARAARKQAAASGPKREQQKAKKSALFFGGGEDDKNAKNTSSTTTLTNQKTEKTQQVEHSNNENKENYKNNSFSEMEAIPRGLSPMDVARRQGHGEIVSILEEHQNKLAREREVRHQERRDAGCLNSDSDAEDAEDRYLLKKYRTSQLMKDEEAAKQVVMPA